MVPEVVPEVVPGGGAPETVPTSAEVEARISFDGGKLPGWYKEALANINGTDPLLGLPYEEGFRYGLVQAGFSEGQAQSLVERAKQQAQQLAEAAAARQDAADAAEAEAARLAAVAAKAAEAAAAAQAAADRLAAETPEETAARLAAEAAEAAEAARLAAETPEETAARMAAELATRRVVERDRFIGKLTASPVPPVPTQTEFYRPDLDAKVWGLTAERPDGTFITITKTITAEEQARGLARMSLQHSEVDGTTDTIFFDNVRNAVRYANHHGFTVTESTYFEQGKLERAQTDAEVAAKQAAATKFAVDVDPLTGQDRAVAQAQADTVQQFTALAQKEGTKEVFEATFRLLTTLGVKVDQKDFKIRANRVVPENPVGLEKLSEQFRAAFTARLAVNRKAADAVFNGLLEKATLEELSALSGSLEKGPRKNAVNKEVLNRLDAAEAAEEQARLAAASPEGAAPKRVRKKKAAPEEKATPEQMAIADAHRAALRTKWEPLAVARGRSVKEFNDGFDRAVDLAAARFDVKGASSKFAGQAGRTIREELNIQTLSPKEQVALDAEVRDSYQKLTNQWEAYARGRGQVVTPELSADISAGIFSALKSFDPALNDNFRGYVSQLMLKKLNRTLTAQEKATSAYAVRLDQENEDGQDSHGRIAGETNTQLTGDESRRTSFTNLPPDANNALGAEFQGLDPAEVKKMRIKLTDDAIASAVAVVKERALKKGSQTAREAAVRYLEKRGIAVNRADFDIPEGKKFSNKSAAVKAEMEALAEIYDSAYTEHYENTRRRIQTNAGNDPSQSGKTPGHSAVGGGEATGRPPVVAPAARGSVARGSGGGRPGGTSPGVGRVPGGEPPQFRDQGREPGRGEPPAKAAAVVDEQFRLAAQDKIEGLAHEKELSEDEADGLTARIATADTNEKIAKVLEDAGVSNIPTFGGAGTKAKTERRFGSLRSKKHLAADGVAYDPQLATVKVGRVAVDARIEQLGAEEKAHVMRLALFLGDRFGEQVRILFDDDAGVGQADPMTAGHHTISVSPSALARGVKDAGEGSSLWLKRLGFEEVAHLATFRQIRADLDKSLGHGSTASEFHEHIQAKLRGVADNMTKEQKAWVEHNYGQKLGAQNLASEYLRMLVQVGRQMGGDRGAGLTEAAWMEAQTPSVEVRSWLRQMVDAMKKMLRIKPDPQLAPLAVGIDKLLLQMEKAAKKGVVVEDEFAAIRRIQTEQKFAQMRGSSERVLRGLDEAIDYASRNPADSKGFGARMTEERMAVANEWLTKNGAEPASTPAEARDRVRETIARAEQNLLPEAANASARQLALGDIPLRVGKTFGEGNPELLKSDATFKEPLDPTKTPIFEAAEKVRAMIHDGPREFFSAKAVNVAGGPQKFVFAPGKNESWQDYYEHFVRPDRGDQAVPGKYDGALSVRQTLLKPQFSLLDSDTQNILFGRVYNDGQIHLVVTTPREGRVVTQFTFNNADNSRHMDDVVSGKRDTWEKTRVATNKGPTTPSPARSQRLDATGSTETHTTEVRPQQPGDLSSSIPAGSKEVDPRQQGRGLPDRTQGRAEDSTGGTGVQGPEAPGGAMPPGRMPEFPDDHAIKLVPMSDASKSALERDLFSLPKEEWQAIMAEQTTASASIRRARQFGYDAKIGGDRGQLTASDKWVEFWDSSNGATLADEAARYRLINEHFGDAPAAPGGATPGDRVRSNSASAKNINALRDAFEREDNAVVLHEVTNHLQVEQITGKKVEQIETSPDNWSWEPEMYRLLKEQFPGPRYRVESHGGRRYVYDDYPELGNRAFGSGPEAPGGAMPLALRQPLTTLAVKEEASYEAAKALFDRKDPSRYFAAMGEMVSSRKAALERHEISPESREAIARASAAVVTHALDNMPASGTYDAFAYNPQERAVHQWLREASRVTEIKAVDFIRTLESLGLTSREGVNRYFDDLAGLDGLGQFKNEPGTDLSQVSLQEFLKENPEMADDLGGYLDGTRTTDAKLVEMLSKLAKPVLPDAPGGADPTRRHITRTAPHLAGEAEAKYQVHSDDAKRTEAKAFLDEHGVDVGVEKILDGSARLLPDTKITALLAAKEHYRPLAAAGDAAAADKLRALDFAAARIGTEVGQSLEAFKSVGWTPEKASADYTRVTIKAQEPLLADPAAKEIKDAVEAGRTEAAEAAVVASEPLFEQVEAVTKAAKAKEFGLTGPELAQAQGVFDFFETAKRADVADEGKVSEAAAQASAKQVMLALQLADPAMPKSVAETAEREALKQVREQLKALLPTDRPAGPTDVQKIILAVDHLNLAEMAFKHTLLKIQEQLGDGAFAGATFDRGRIEGIAHYLRDRVDVRAQTRRTLAQRGTTLEALKAQLAADTAGLRPDQAQAVAKALESAFNEAVQKSAQGQLEALVKRSTAAKKRVTKNVAVRIMENVNLGSFSDPRFYDAVAPGFDLPAYDPVVAAEITRRSDAIQRMLSEGREGFQTDHGQRALIAYIEQQGGAANVDKWVALFYANILSGFTTQLKNTVSTALQGTAEILTMTAARGLSSPEAFVRAPLDLARSLAAFAKGAGKGFTEAASILQSGVGGERTGDKLAGLRGLESNPFTDAPLFKNDSVLKKAANLLLTPVTRLMPLLNQGKYVSRTMAAADALFYRGAAEARAEMMAQDIVRHELKITDPILAARKVAEILNGGGGNVAKFRAEAEAKARGEGLVRGIPFRMRVAELIEQARPDKIREGADRFAARATFNHKPEGLLGMGAEAINLISDKHPLLKTVVPFSNVVSNVLNTALDYTPIGLHRTGLLGGRGWESRNTGEERAQQLVKVVGGTAAMVALYLMFKDDEEDDEEAKKPRWRIHGKGPSNADLRKQKVATGWVPFSIETPGGRYYTYTITPAAVGLAIVGNVLDAERYDKAGEKGWGTRLAFAVGQSAQVITSQSFLGGVADLFEAMDARNPENGAKGVQNFLSRTSSSMFIPNLVKQVNRVFDENVYQPAGLAEMMARDVPFVRTKLRPALNVLGDNVTRGVFDAFLNQRTDDPVWSFLASSDLTLRTPKKGALGDRRMTDDELYFVVKESGAGVKKWLSDPAHRARLSAMKLEHAQELLDEVSQSQQARAKDLVRRKAAHAGTLFVGR